MKEWVFKYWMPLGLAIVSTGSLIYSEHTKNSWQEAQTLALAASQADFRMEQIDHRFNEVVGRASFLVKESETLGTRPDLKEKILKSHLAQDPNLLAIAVYRMVAKEWTLTYRLIRDIGDDLRLTRSDFEELNQESKIPFTKIEPRKTHGWFAPFKGQPLIRIAHGLDEGVIVVADTLYQGFQSMFHDQSSGYFMVINQDHELVLQNDSNHFKIGENLKHLPVFSAAEGPSSNGFHGLLKEFPGSNQEVYSTKLVRGKNHNWNVIAQVPLNQAALSLTAFRVQLGVLLLFAIPGFFGSIYSLFKSKNERNEWTQEVSKVIVFEKNNSLTHSQHTLPEISPDATDDAGDEPKIA